MTRPRISGSHLTVTNAPPDAAAPDPGAESDGPPRPRRRLSTALRAASGLALLGVLLWRLPDFDPADMLPDLSVSTLGWIVLAIAIRIGAYVLQTARWQAVMLAMQVRVRFRLLLSDLLAGEFVSNLLPTSFGGDVVRIWRLGRRLDDNATAFATTALERLTGWLVLPTICLTTLALSPRLRSLGSPTSLAFAISVGTVVALVAIILAAGHTRGGGRLTTSTGWRGWLGAVHRGVVGLRRHPTAGLRLAAAGIGFQLAQCVSVWACARALQIPEVGIAVVCAFFPPTAIAQNLPISLGGLGVREGAFVVFLGALGVSDARAVALGLVVYLVFMVASAAGAPAVALGGLPGRSRPAGSGA